MTTPVVAAVNGSALAVALTKKLMREHRCGEPDETATVFRGGDAMEGARAFAERTPLVWSGR